MNGNYICITRPWINDLSHHSRLRDREFYHDKGSYSIFITVQPVTVDAKLVKVLDLL